VKSTNYEDSRYVISLIFCYFPSLHFALKTFSIYGLPLGRNTVSQPYETVGKIIVLYG